ncbi:MAG: glycosyltransferase [Pseudomonadales bacterium]|nr:glycosyltransferase [Pseudomonadales bacterium]
MIVFWRISYSPHMDSLFGELRKLVGEENVRVVYFEHLRDERIAQGWVESISGSPYTLLQPNERQLVDLLSLDNKDVIHVFTGILYYKPMRKIFYRLRRTACKKVILSEGREFTGLKGKLRWLQSYWIEARNKRYLHKVLAYGHRGVATYRAIGVEPEKIHSFAYVVDSMENNLLSDGGVEECSLVHLGVIGRLIPLKRVDLVIKSLSFLASDDWKLTIIGDGEERKSLEAMLVALGISQDKVSFTGVLPNEDVKAMMKCFDYTLFPSNGDGWGAVVNESLLAGTPVICSRYPGAADLIHDGFNGWTFDTDSEEQFQDILSKVIEDGPIEATKRQSIKDWSKCITSPEVAKYFIEIMKDNKSDPSWKLAVPLEIT